jgi:signal transduction histidine kinase/CheY-like chemotaxis protein
MENGSDERNEFEIEVTNRFGILPSFFRSAKAAPELIRQLWGFAKAGYLDNPMPSLFKERLFVWLSRFCPARYCIVRHSGFLLGHGRPAGDSAVAPHTIEGVMRLLTLPTPWHRDMNAVYHRLEALRSPAPTWPDAGTELEDDLFACAALIFVEPARNERARLAIVRTVGERQFEFLIACLAFVRTAHYWTLRHPEIETEDDMNLFMSQHEELKRLLLNDPEADRSEMGQRLFGELTDLRALHERQELENAKRSLEEKDRQKDQFIAVLAHELRNPLAAIRSATDAMSLLELNDPRARRLRERLDRQTTAMVQMLDDLLDASRVAFGKVAVHCESVDLFELLRDALDEQEPRSRQAELHLETQAFAGKIFEPFTQSDLGLDRTGGGLGLGLSIASRLAGLQGGSLLAESAGRGQGSTFTLRIPRECAAGVAPTEMRPMANGSHQKSILLVEDNTDVADTLAELLGLAGFQVCVAYDGLSAIRCALDSTPDFVLCDLGLPGAMDGYAVARALRAEPALQCVRLIAASGYSGPEYSARAKTAGFESLLPKPITLEVLERLAR